MAGRKPREIPATWLDQFVDGELGPEERVLVTQKLEQDPEYKANYDRLMKMRALIREVCIEEGNHAVLDDVYPEVMRRIQEEPAGFKKRLADWIDQYRLGLSSLWAPVGIGATVVVAVFAGVLIVQSSRHQGEGSGGSPAMTQSESVGPVVPDQPTLAVTDGTSIRRPRHEESGFHKNEAYIMNYSAESGIVVIDLDPEGDLPAVVWHITEDRAETVIEGEPI